jgi:hypothetical protein
MPFVRQLNNDFPKTSPRFDQVIPAGQTGWTKFWGTSDVGIIGAVIKQEPEFRYGIGSVQRRAQPAQADAFGDEHLRDSNFPTVLLSMDAGPDGWQ